MARSLDAIPGPVLDPRAEAEARLDGRYHALVLEPSPPAVGAPWFADDPTVPGPLECDGDRPLVSPVGNGDVTWSDLCADDPDLADWCAARSLACWPTLPPAVPDDLVTTRLALHAVAEHVVCPARFHANGKIGLRFARGGFATPYFWGGGDTRQVRVEADALVVTDGGGVHRHSLTTLGEAAEAAGVAPGAPVEVFTPTTEANAAAPLAIDPASAALLGQWFGLAAAVLEQLRADLPAGDPPARVQLWPEHFDLATDLGAEADGSRITVGASPGDAAIPEPYLYVLPWAEVERGGFWNAESFTGAQLRYAALAGVDDPRSAALQFFHQAREALDAH